MACTVGKTAREGATLIKYARRSNVWLEARGGTWVRPTQGSLRKAAKAAAAAEKEFAAQMGRPYMGQVGHVPDVALTGMAEPPMGWLDMPGYSNQAAGGVLGRRIGDVVKRILINGAAP